MPTVELDYEDFIRLLSKKYKPEELQESISMFGVDLEKIDEKSIVMEVFPNRPDILSVEGFTREMRAFLGIETGLKNYEVHDSDVEIKVHKSVENVRPYIGGAIIKDVSLDEKFLISIMNLQEKLHITHGRNRKKVAIGVHDFKKLEPPLYYTTYKGDEISFVPLDSTKKMTLEEILKEHPKGIEYSWILKNSSRYPIILDKSGEVVSFPPIINAEKTRVTLNTRDLLIEVTGTDKKAVLQALNIVVTSIAERCGKIYAVNIVREN